MKKNKIKELDVDSVGGQKPLSKEDEKKISEYINSQKHSKSKKKSRIKKEILRKKRVL